MKKNKIAITGNIGSGKSTFSEYLVQRGCAVIIADDISKNLLRNNDSIKKKVSKLFGKSAYIGGRLNNKFIADKVFSNPGLLNELNSILHPNVLLEIDSIINRDYSNHKFIFIESALVYETDIEKRFGYVVLITSDFNIRLQRTSGKGEKITEEDFRKRERNQIPQTEKEKRADFIFTNNGSKAELYKKADLLLLTLGFEIV